MGATTITLTQQFPVGGFRLAAGTCTLSSSYAANGDTCTPAQFGLTSISLILFDYHAAGLLFSYDYSAGKLKAFYPTGGATTAPSTATAVPQVTTGVATASAVNATTPALTPGVGKEVAATADLSGVTIHVVAFGT